VVVPPDPVNRGREREGEKGKGGKREGMGRRRVGDEGYRMGRGWYMEEGEREKGGKHIPLFSPTPLV
jgi:hypothetical protein